MTRDLGSNRRELQGKVVTIFAADNPKDDCKELEGFFPSGFKLHVGNFGPPHPLTVIHTAVGEAPAAAAQSRIGAVGGGSRITITKGF